MAHGRHEVDDSDGRDGDALIADSVGEEQLASRCRYAIVDDVFRRVPAAAAVGGGQQATIIAAGSSQADLTDTFSELVVPTPEAPTTAAPTTAAPTTAAPTTAAPTTGAPTTEPPTTLNGTLPATGGGTNVFWPGVLLLGAGGTTLLVTRRRPASRSQD